MEFPEYSPEWFVEQFKAVYLKQKPKKSFLHGKSEIATQNFEKWMLALGTRAKLHCQNNRTNKQYKCEWMKIDHIFTPKDAYDSFPLIAVEHENGDFDKATKIGELPAPERSAKIEWALWKVLSVRCQLSVLVAYPRIKVKDNAMKVLEQMLSGWKLHYGMTPNSLILFGWIEDRGYELHEKNLSDFFYTAYCPMENNGHVELIEVKEKNAE